MTRRHPSRVDPNVDLETIEFITVNDMARLAGNVNHFTVRRWIDHGDLPAYKVAGSVRIRRADAAQFLLGSPINPAAKQAS